MTNSDHKQSRSLISNAFGVAKKLSATSLDLVNHVAPGTIAKLTQAPNSEQVITGTARTQSPFEKRQYDNPQQMMREHLPKVSSQLLGKHYKKVNQVASFISPDLNEKLSDYLFDKLNDVVSQFTSVDALLKEVGAKNLAELANDPERAARISQTLANQNKLIATLQGAVTGSAGAIGAALDVPTSLALALRSIYHTGRAYGFELQANDHDIVEYIFKQIDLGAVAEKQALLATIRTLSQIAQTHNISQLQQLLGSGNDVELLKKWLSNDAGEFKWSWMSNLPNIGLVSRLTPLVSIGISAGYSWKLVDDATNQAQKVFYGARQYLIEYPNENVDALTAYEKFLLKAPVALLESSTDYFKDGIDAAPENEDEIIQIQEENEQATSQQAPPSLVPQQEDIQVKQEKTALVTIENVAEKDTQKRPIKPRKAVTKKAKEAETKILLQNNEADKILKPNETEKAHELNSEEEKPAAKKRIVRKTVTNANVQVESIEDK